ncbi:lia operon protein LiaG [Anaerosolibacter carboniphilus]|uniref:Lia operon protein LiaG n=1 Tax=Anaerosolibacter carboniphilus TaxID=1417629 RepID=A0A841KT04_9FIRM|nr:DUF4097 family beta strand repeat-containing protein [Anaerosolibacter carboniphilus]MBB6216726.1 lia operon protein LiaG [Anaerosolibacter carboniphilus]
MNIKKIVIYLALIAVVGIGIGLAIASFTGGFFSSSNESSGSFSVDDVQIGTMEGITQIVIEGVTADINIIPEERNDIKSHFYGKITSSDLPKMKVTVSGNKVTVKVEESKKMHIEFSSSDLTLDVFIPKNYGGDLKVGSVSGDVKMQEEWGLSDISLNLTSGDAKIQHLTAKNLSFESVSGDLTMEDISTESTRIEVVSGDMNINNFKGNLKGKSTSGNFKISYLTFDYDIDFEAVSGDIIIDLPDDAAFALDAEALGDIACDFPVTVNGKSEKNQLKGVVKSENNKVVLRNTSGNITIR